MLISRVLEVQGARPADSLRGFLVRLMDQGLADRLFAPVSAAEGGARSEVVAASAYGSVDPLVPIMTENSAVALRVAMQAEPERRWLAVLRPCEQRAVVELAKRQELNLDRLILVGVDCLSTFDPEFVAVGAARNPGDPAWLTRHALRLAQAGQVVPSGARLACRLCERPAPDYRAANILIGLVGVKTDELILILADEVDDHRLALESVTTRPATEREAVEREVTLWRLMERRKEAADRLLEELGLSDAYPGVIFGYMHRCTLCGECIDACPQSSDSLRTALAKGREAFIEVLLNESLRLASCSGCGACQLHCPEGIPLCAISRAMSRQIQQRMHYVPGRDVREPLPWSN